MCLMGIFAGLCWIYRSIVKPAPKKYDEEFGAPGLSQVEPFISLYTTVHFMYWIESTD